MLKIAIGYIVAGVYYAASDAFRRIKRLFIRIPK